MARFAARVLYLSEERNQSAGVALRLAGAGRAGEANRRAGLWGAGGLRWLARRPGVRVAFLDGLDADPRARS